MLITRHRIEARDFTMLAHGDGDATTTRTLAAVQRSRHALLLRAVLDAARARPREAAAAQLTAAVRLLDLAQRKAPADASVVFGYPLTGAWAAHCLRRLRHNTPASVPLWVDLSHLASIAAAAAVRAGLTFEITVPLRGGTAVLPTLGAATVPVIARWGVGTVGGSGRTGYLIAGQHGTVALPEDPCVDGPGWSGLRHLTLSHGDRRLSVYLDDLDPYRSSHLFGPADRLPADAYERWCAVLAGAWTELVDRHPHRAAELEARSLTVVPLTGRDTGANATARDSVGAMALTPPPNPSALAQSMIHEYQHSKLGSLLDLVDLYELTDRRRFYSPWRRDPRPLSGLLQGAYAFLAVAEFWLAHSRAVGPIDKRLAAYELARVRGQVATAVRTLFRSGALTAAGRRFVAGLRARVEELEAVPVGLPAVRLATLVNDDHRITWRLRNAVVAPDTVKALTEAWTRGDSPPPRRPATVAAAAAGYTEDPRHELARRIAAGQCIAATSPDADLLAGDYAGAADLFGAAVRKDPDRIEAWSGLVLARSRVGPTGTIVAYRDEPEVVRDLYLALRDVGVDPEPDALANWLAG